MTAPFGIPFSQALDPEIVIAELSAQKFQVSPPNPHPGFADYIVQCSPTMGVVWIKGIGNEIGNDVYGSGLITAHSTMSGQLIAKYGQPERTDLLSHDAIWVEPRDWVASLNQNERFYFDVWKRPASNQLPDDVASIFLGFQTYSMQDGAIILEYASIKHEAAEAELAASFSDFL